MTAAIAHRTAQAAEVRVGDTLIRGEITGLRSRPIRSIGGGVEITFADGTTDHVPYASTVIVLAWGPDTMSWS